MQFNTRPFSKRVFWVPFVYFSGHCLRVTLTLIPDTLRVKLSALHELDVALILKESTNE